jgi:sarcosine oxidase
MVRRRQLLKMMGAAGATASAGALATAGEARGRESVIVVGAGVFGVWTALFLHRAGKRVTLVDAVSPAHTAASSGGESRATRCGYGPDQIYTEWAYRSIPEWKALSARASLPLFHQLGVLWVAGDGDAAVDASARVLSASGVPFERLTSAELRRRFPVMRVGDDESGFLEPHGGALMARRAVQHLAQELAADGVRFLRATVRPVRAGQAVDGALPGLALEGSQRLLQAEQFVFACGPWLDRVCPEAMAGRLFVSRQEVVYFGASRAHTGELPVWSALPFYGFPDLEGRGFKVANDEHGEPVADVSTLERRVTEQSVEQAREFLAQRFPSLASRPVTETRVCQYENSANGDFIVDRHPGLDNVWLAGGGSGHGFKHGPALGEHVAGRVLGTTDTVQRFSLAAKAARQSREVH